MRTDKIRQLRAAIGSTEASRWPTCLHCTAATEAGGVAFERWIPVESYRVEPQVFRPVPLLAHGGSVEVGDMLNPPRQLGDRGWFTVIATCHGKEQKAEVDVPARWGTEHVRAAIQGLLFFGGPALHLVKL